MMKNCILLLSFLLHYVSGQRSITIPITLDGNPFNITFPPDLVKASDISNKLCRENLELLKLTQETFPVCINQVSSYLDNVIESYHEKLSVKVSLNLEGNDFSVRYRPDLVSAEKIATKLCSENAELLHINQESLSNCVSPVANYLQESAESFIKSRTVEFPININNQDFTLKFRTDLNTPIDVATQLCENNYEKFGLTKEQIIPNCVNPASEYIRAEIAKAIKARQLTIPITLENVKYELSFQPDIDSATEAANQLCYKDRERLELNDETFPVCVEKILNYIIDYVTSLYTKSAKESANDSTNVNSVNS